MTKVHGVDVSGRTGEELLAWHDAIHEMERYGRITTGKLPTPRKTRRVIRLVDACPF